MKTLQELLQPEDPAWPDVQEWIRGASVPVAILPYAHPERERCLEWLQVTTRSPLGAIAYETGGLLVDHGWVRVLGSGHPRLSRSILGWNRGRSYTDGSDTRSHVLVADDVMGGLFALDCGGLGFKPGQVAYFPPDTLRWESLDAGYSDFINLILSERLAGFYADYRWDGWEPEVQSLDPNQAFLLTPPPFLKGEPFGKRQRNAVPMAEHYGLSQDFAEQLREVPDGAEIVLRVGKRPAK